MSGGAFLLTRDDLLASGVEGMLSRADEPECFAYYSVFLAAERLLTSAADAKQLALVNLLVRVTGMHLDVQETSEPFLPNFVGPNGRTAIPGDLDDSELLFLEEIINDISDAELRARIADVLWVRKRDHKMARLAIESYLASATRLEDPAEWPPCEKRIRRALQLAARLGRANREPFDAVVAHIEGLIGRLDGNDPLFLSSCLMEMLQAHKVGDASVYAPLAEKAALRAEGIGRWDLARQHWMVKARWHAQAPRDEDSYRAAQIRVAETYVGEGEAALLRTPPSFMVAAHFYELSIEAFRAVGHSSARIDEIHKIMLGYQKQALGEFKLASVEIDAKKLQEQSIARVTGKGLNDALLALAQVSAPPSAGELRATVIALGQHSVLQHLMPSTLVNVQGKTVAARGALVSGDTDAAEVAMLFEMHQYAAKLRSAYVGAVIEPARYQITLEHDFGITDLLPFTAHNPFICPGHEMTAATGLAAGLRGDFVTAGHLLAIQMETSIRHVIASRGVPTSTVNDGIQMEIELGALLRLPMALEVFGEDRIFELKGLLVEQAGSNLRNLVAHGLVEHQAFFSNDFSYLWWSFLQLCSVPYFGRRDAAG